MGNLLGYDFQSYPNSQKISHHILTYPFISYHIPTYRKISSGANSQMTMRRWCDAAMRRRRDHTDGDATAQKPAQKPAQVFLAKIQEDSDIYSSRYVQVFWTWTVGIWYLQVGIWWLCVGMSGEIPSHTYHVNLRYMHIVTHTFRQYNVGIRYLCVIIRYLHVGIKKVSWHYM